MFQPGMVADSFTPMWNGTEGPNTFSYTGLFFSESLIISKKQQM